MNLGQIDRILSESLDYEVILAARGTTTCRRVLFLIGGGHDDLPERSLKVDRSEVNIKDIS